jgi:CRP-like cAMP-binding protein
MDRFDEALRGPSRHGAAERLGYGVREVGTVWRAPGSEALSLADIPAVEMLARPRRVPAGMLLFATGDPVTSVVVVRTGEIKLLARAKTGRRVTVGIVRTAGVVADTAMLLGSPSPVDAVTSQPSLLLELDADGFSELLRHSPSLTLQWMASLAGRLEQDRRRIVAITTRGLAAQVAYVLLEHEELEGDRAVVRLTHEVIAHLIGARRQSVSRVIQQLRAQGLVRTGYRMVVLHDRGALARTAGTDLTGSVAVPAPTSRIAI